MKKKTLFLLIASAFLVRIVPASLVYGTCDVDAFKHFADLLIQGKWCLYSYSDHAVYPPLFPWISYAIKLLSNLSGISFSTLIKIPSIVADACISVLIYYSSVRLGAKEKGALGAGLWYALQPVSILITSIHGQFDSLVLVFCLLSWFLFEFKKKFYFSALCLGIGILLKGYPVILLPLFLLKLQNRREMSAFAVSALLPAFLSFIPYLITDPVAVFNIVLKYSPRPENWGYTLVLASLANHFPSPFITSLQKIAAIYGKYLLLGGFLLFYKSASRFKLLDSIILIFSLFYALTAGFGLQYLVWIVPFAILDKRFPLRYYTFFATAWLLISYAYIISHAFYKGLITIIDETALWKIAVAVSLCTWLVCVVWVSRKLLFGKKSLAQSDFGHG